MPAPRPTDDARRLAVLAHIGVEPVVLGRAALRRLRAAAATEGAGPAEGEGAAPEPPVAAPRAASGPASSAGRPSDGPARALAALREEPSSGDAPRRTSRPAAAPTDPTPRKPANGSLPRRFSLELVTVPGWVLVLPHEDLRTASRRGRPSQLFADLARALAASAGLDAGAAGHRHATFRWPPWSGEEGDGAPAPGPAQAAAALDAGLRGLCEDPVGLCALGTPAATLLENLGRGDVVPGPSLEEVMALGDGKRALWARLGPRDEGA